MSAKSRAIENAHVTLFDRLPVSVLSSSMLPFLVPKTLAILRLVSKRMRNTLELVRWTGKTLRLDRADWETWAVDLSAIQQVVRLGAIRDMALTNIPNLHPFWQEAKKWRTACM